MTTMLESRTQIDQIARHHVEMGGEVDCIMQEGHILVLRASRIEKDRAKFEYLSTTHWGSGGALIVRTSRNNDPQLQWASGGTCSDASAEDIARVMVEVWKDALELLSKRFSLGC